MFGFFFYVFSVVVSIFLMIWLLKKGGRLEGVIMIGFVQLIFSLMHISISIKQVAEANACEVELYRN